MDADEAARMWSQLTPPVRPSAEGLEVYRSQLAALPQRRVLILGATPELIDLALELDAERVVSVEQAAPVAEGMRRLGARDWGRVEMVVGDWLEAREDWRSAFTFVACDGGLLFVPYPDGWAHLFRLVRGYLEPGGVLTAKSWAEPPGQSAYDDLERDMIARFDAGDRSAEAYRRLASELRVANMVGAAKHDGSFDPQLLLDRCDRSLAEFEARFPEPEFVEITHAAFKYLTRTRPGSMDLLTGVSFAGAKPLLAEAGFEDLTHFPLPDPPVPGGNYTIVAR